MASNHSSSDPSNNTPIDNATSQSSQLRLQTPGEGRQLGAIPDAKEDGHNDEIDEAQETSIEDEDKEEGSETKEPFDATYLESQSRKDDKLVSGRSGRGDGTSHPLGSQDPSLAKFYEPLKSYEGYHRWDPKATWSKAEEKRLVRKVDARVFAWVCLMFFAMQLDRGNISNALSDNMLDDLSLTNDEYNNGQTIYYCCFLFMEMPSQLISKRLGVDVWLPIQMMIWSIIAALQCKLSGKSSFYATRALVGMFEGGFIPDIILYLSYFYKGHELPIRLSLFWSTLQLTTIISSFMAYGILHMRGLNGWGGWRYLFLIEGGLTAIIGFLSYWWLPPSPTQTKSWFRGKDGWFNEKEEVILVNRILRDDPSKGDMHNRQGLDLDKFWRALTDYDLWGLYLIGLLAFIPMKPEENYLTLRLRALGFSTFHTNLLTIPAYVGNIITMILLTRLAKWTNQRSLTSLLTPLWVLPLLIALETLPDSTGSWTIYSLLTLVLAYPYCHPIVVAWNSSNSGSVRTRTISASLYNMSVQVGNIIATQIYRDSDKPAYRKGNATLLGIDAAAIVCLVGVKLYYLSRNKKRERIWSSMTPEEREHYLSNTKDQGNKRLDFRFVH